jgi:L-threonylcarbamoyladenylate synthase
MKTKILKATELNINKASNCLKNDNLIGLPTETVYGLAANALSNNAVSKIFVAKNRPQDNPLIVHIHKDYNLLNLVSEINDTAKLLLKHFTPGPLTLIFKSNNKVSPLVSGQLNTVAIRIPSHPVAQELLRVCNLPLAAPSANISTRISATTALSVKEELNGKIGYILDGGTCKIGIESTVIDVTKTVPIILRPGKITKEQLMAVCGKVIEKNHFKKESKVLSPGMKYKHYSPKCPVELVNNLKKQYEFLINNKYKPVVLGLEKNLKNLTNMNKLLLGSTIEDYAKNLYETLRLAEKKYDYILLFKPQKTPFGKSIENRIKKMIK